MSVDGFFDLNDVLESILWSSPHEVNVSVVHRQSRQSISIHLNLITSPVNETYTDSSPLVQLRDQLFQLMDTSKTSTTPLDIYDYATRATLDVIGSAGTYNYPHAMR